MNTPVDVHHAARRPGQPSGRSPAPDRGDPSGPPAAAAPPVPSRAGRWGAFAATYTAQLARTRVARVPLLFVATLQSVGILLLLRGIVDPAAGVAGGIATTAPHVVAGATVLVVAFVALNLLAQRFGGLRASGALDYYRGLPAAPTAIVLATAAAYATFTLPGAVLTAILGAWLYALPVAHLWVLAPVLVLSAAGLAGLGATLGLLAPRSELATVAGQLGMSVVLFLGLIPPDRLPWTLAEVRAVVPSTPAVDALAEAFTSAPDWSAVATDLAVCAGVALLALGLAATAYRRATAR